MSSVGVVIISYNTKSLTQRAIESVQKFGKDYNPEIVVVDNNSRDGSKEYLQRLKKEKKIKLIENTENIGFSKANNQGIKILTTDYILLLNSDAALTKGSLSELISFSEKENKAGAVVPMLLNADGSTQDSIFMFPTLMRAINQYWFGKQGYFGSFAPKVNKPIQVEVAVMAAFLITPRGRRVLPFLNEKYFMFFEDFDYCRELQKRGFSIYYVPTAKVYHDKGASGKNVATNENQWKRLIPSSKLYHGILVHYLIWFVMWTSQKFRLTKKYA